MKKYSDINLIIERTIPLTLGVLAIMSVQLIDTMFIGELGLGALTAQGLTLPFSTLIISVQVGLSVAATSTISRFIGKGDQLIANHISTLFLTIGGATLAALTFSLWLAEELLFYWFVDGSNMSLEQDIVKAQFHAYWATWLASSFFGALFYFVSSVYRANHDSKTPGYMLIVSSILNLILDPVLIFILGYGITGAAMATSIAFLVCLLCMLLPKKARNWFSWLPFNKRTYRYLKDLIVDSLATVSNQFLPAVSAMATVYLVASIGPEAVATWGVAMRLEGFLLVFSLSLTMSIPPIISGFIGAKQFEKVGGIVNEVTKLTLVLHTAISLLIFAVMSPLVSLIGQGVSLEQEVQSILMLFPVSYGPLGLCMVMVSILNAYGLPKLALKVSFIRLFLFYIPAIFIGVSTNHIENVILAASIANVLAGIFAWIIVNRQLREIPYQTKVCDSK
ncbi:MATE family efflux transporter [Vibrio crassostreae]|uniref:MATE family efflux transporter n=1 Tax=Vibrio crassostreae TaxID=246167 RepID=UPI001B3154D8|nr:MATE family efflux transporter [Vibrio crassostreae]